VQLLAVARHLLAGEVDLDAAAERDALRRAASWSAGRVRRSVAVMREQLLNAEGFVM